MASKRIAKIVLISGMIIAAFGLLFTAQSKSEIAPQSSFMYNNPQWTVHGIAVAAFCFVVTATEFVLLLYQRSSRKVFACLGSLSIYSTRLYITKVLNLE